MGAQPLLKTNLQQDVLTLLVHSDDQGQLIHRIVDATLFEGEYRMIADKALAYWKEYGQAPKVHMGDLLADILDDKANRKAGTFVRILHSMDDLYERGVNQEYVTKQ